MDTTTTQGMERRKDQLERAKIASLQAKYRKTGSPAILQAINNITGLVDLDISPDGQFSR
jgi:hypothetical protein